MKLLILTQARIEGELEPKVHPLGKVAIDMESITTVYTSIGKYDDIIPNAVQIMTKSGHNFLVIGNFDSIIEQLQQSNIS